LVAAAVAVAQMMVAAVGKMVQSQPQSISAASKSRMDV
jgi:hypothetical protein